MLLGGRSAEEIAFGEISTGAQNDLQRATDIARAMVTEFGMSEALGAVNYNGHRGGVPRHPFVQERGNYSEDTARKIDAEVKRILTDAHKRARAGAARAPRHPRRALDPAARKEVIEGDELRTLLGAVPPKDPDTVPLPVPDEGRENEPAIALTRHERASAWTMSATLRAFCLQEPLRFADTVRTLALLTILASLIVVLAATEVPPLYALLTSS